jgi:hypothetical protein
VTSWQNTFMAKKSFHGNKILSRLEIIVGHGVPNE